MVSVLGPLFRTAAVLFRTAGHTVHTQHGVTASVGQRGCDVEISNYHRDPALPFYRYVKEDTSSRSRGSAAT